MGECSCDLELHEVGAVVAEIHISNSSWMEVVYYPMVELGVFWLIPNANLYGVLVPLNAK